MKTIYHLAISRLKYNKGRSIPVSYTHLDVYKRQGLSIVENPKLHGKSYNKWLGDQAKPSHRELLRVAIDNALSQSPADFEELLKLLQEYGCEVSKRGKSYRLKLSGWEKACLLYTS